MPEENGNNSIVMSTYGGDSEWDYCHAIAVA